MIKIRVNEIEVYDEQTSSFSNLPSKVFRFEHSLKAISKWESGNTMPGIDSIIEISNFFDVTIDSLLKDDTLRETFDETEKDIAFRQLAGAWANDPEADAMTSAIRDGRTSNHTRQLASFDE